MGTGRCPHRQVSHRLLVLQLGGHRQPKLTTQLRNRRSEVVWLLVYFYVAYQVPPYLHSRPTSASSFWLEHSLILPSWHAWGLLSVGERRNPRRTVANEQLGTGLVLGKSTGHGSGLDDHATGESISSPGQGAPTVGAEVVGDGSTRGGLHGEGLWCLTVPLDVPLVEDDVGGVC